MLVREEWQPLGCLVASPILCSIMPTLDPLRDKSEGLRIFFLHWALAAVKGLYQTLLGNHWWVLSDIQCLDLVYNAVEGDPPENEKLLAVCCEPWVFPHVLHVDARPWPLFLGPALFCPQWATLRDKVLFLPEEQFCPLFTMKVLKSPGSGFSACDTTCCTCGHPSRLPALLLLGGMAQWHRYVPITHCAMYEWINCLWLRTLTSSVSILKKNSTSTC